MMAFSSTIKREQIAFHLLVFPRLIFVILWTDASHSWTKHSGPVIGARWAEVDAYSLPRYLRYFSNMLLFYFTVDTENISKYSNFL